MKSENSWEQNRSEMSEREKTIESMLFDPSVIRYPDLAAQETQQLEELIIRNYKDAFTDDEHVIITMEKSVSEVNSIGDILRFLEAEYIPRDRRSEVQVSVLDEEKYSKYASGLGL